MARHYFGKMNHGMHPSKEVAFPNTCSVCGKPLRKNSKNKIGFICRKCGPSMRGNNEHAACHSCPQNYDCTVRVAIGLWVRCETPDYADLERLKVSGGLNDERVLAELDKCLEQRGQRKILEEAISKSAPQIYQGDIEGFEGQISIGLRVDG